MQGLASAAGRVRLCRLRVSLQSTDSFATQIISPEQPGSPAPAESEWRGCSRTRVWRENSCRVRAHKTDTPAERSEGCLVSLAVPAAAVCYSAAASQGRQLVLTHGRARSWGGKGRYHATFLGNAQNWMSWSDLPCMLVPNANLIAATCGTIH